MTYMLCRNRVKDYTRWKALFDSEADTCRAAGLRLLNLWRCVEEPNNVFFLFEVESMDDARDFISSPDSTEVGEAAGVIDGEYFFLEDAPG